MNQAPKISLFSTQAQPASAKAQNSDKTSVAQASPLLRSVQVSQPSKPIQYLAKADSSASKITLTASQSLSEENPSKNNEKLATSQAAAQPLNQTTDALSLADHFDAMNRELSKGAGNLAVVHLKAIQLALSPTSISRLRAEGWCDYHLGNFESAKSIYRKILNRVPGDENATSVLLAIESKNSVSGLSK